LAGKPLGEGVKAFYPARTGYRELARTSEKAKRKKNQVDLNIVGRNGRDSPKFRRGKKGYAEGEVGGILSSDPVRAFRRNLSNIARQKIRLGSR